MNKPVAWMNQKGNVIPDDVKEAEKVDDFVFKNYTIPLYTHPANPYQSITDTKIEPTGVSYTHPVKELTDEEILYFYKPCFYHAEDFIDEVRAILRKAQEK